MKKKKWKNLTMILKIKKFYEIVIVSYKFLFFYFIDMLI